MTKLTIPLTCNQLVSIIFVGVVVGWIYYTFVDLQFFGGMFLGAWVAILGIKICFYCSDHGISIGCKCDKK